MAMACRTMVFFSANAQHPDVQLGYNNNNDGSNVVFSNSGSTASTSIDLAQTQIGNYDNLHVFATATNGATDLQIDLQYADGTESFTTTVTDWFKRNHRRNDLWRRDAVLSD